MNKKTSSPLSVWRPMALERFLLGVPHYPEHVDESFWERDALRMKEAGFNTVRMGEFAWHLWEPYAGHFEFDLFDRAIEVLAKHGIKTILCTPTATPPRWLTQAHPEILRVDENGRPASHGSRQHGDTTSPVLRDHSRRITLAMAEHYVDNENVIGWQTDNELNTTVSTSYSESCAAEFRKWCQIKYRTIEALNKAWGGHFWATHYNNFDQLVLPFPDAPSFLSPGHEQDYHRFLADAVARFQRDQVEILRAANPDWFIFHNLGNLVDIDFRGDFGQDLDFIGFDIYPMLYDEFRRDGGHAYSQALHLDQCRAYSGNFIVPEQASGLGSQPAFASMNPEPGEMRRMALSSVARGADSLMFFRWRPAHFGAEIYWMGVIDHDDQPRRRYAEAQQFGKDIAAIESDLLGTSVRMDVAIAGGDFDNQIAYQTYPMGLPSPLEDARHLHRALYRQGIATGFIHPEDDLSCLKALYVPHWLIWDDRWTEKLQKFVEDGGTLVVSAMTATRTRDNHIPTHLAPCNELSTLLGVQVEEFGRITAPGCDGMFDSDESRKGFGPSNPPREPASSSNRIYRFQYRGATLPAAHIYEKLKLADDVDVLATWDNRFLKDEAAITCRKVNKGQAIYIGTYLTDALAEKLSEQLQESAGVEPVLAKCPEQVEVTERFAKDGRRLLFVLNTDETAAEVDLAAGGYDLLSDTQVSGQVTMQGYEAMVLRL